MASNLHPDGTICPEGTQIVPDNYQPCCEEFGARTVMCYHDIRYEYWDNRVWHIVIAPSVGGGGIAMLYCPHCGAAL
jgi:hypothetical protein